MAAVSNRRATDGAADAISGAAAAAAAQERLEVGARRALDERSA
jgi:hypothetical protein